MNQLMNDRSASLLPTRQRRRLAASIAVAAVSVLGAGQLASAAVTPSKDLPPAYTDCDAEKATQPFAPYGDFNLYAEVVNGSFDDGLTGWKVTGKSAEVVETDAGPALEIVGGTKVLSPAICFDETRPHARMFTRILAAEDVKDTEGIVQVQVAYDRVKGGIKRIKVGEFDQTASSTEAFTPSPEMNTALTDVRKHVEPDADGNRWFKFQFKVKGHATWQFDDLFIDPRRRA
jgi:hypothetical protein